MSISLHLLKVSPPFVVYFFVSLNGMDNAPVLFIGSSIREFFEESHDVIKESEVPVSIESAVSVFDGSVVIVPEFGVMLYDVVESAVELRAIFFGVVDVNLV